MLIVYRFSFVAFLVLMTMTSCRETATAPYKNLTKDSFADMYEPAYRLNSHAIRRGIDSLMRADNDAFKADWRTRNYYRSQQPFLWISREGILERADTALAYLWQAAGCGLDTSKLRVRQIADDIRRLRSLDVHGQGGEINKIMARVEYNLTRAYIRYSSGQMFGFVNPDKLYNNIEKCDSDTVTGRVKYSHLCDLRVRRPDSLFFATAISKAFNDSVGQFITAAQPRGILYDMLVKRLNSAPLSASERVKTLCNIERCRWRQRGYNDFNDYSKYIVVNVPSCALRAVNEESVLSMRVGVGTLDHKTPLLTSSVKRMDLNPQWIIPKNIAKGIVGRCGYMHSEGMFVYDKKRGKLPPEAASYSKVMDGEQHIVQAGGAKNPLGRIIFRFDNSFSVYLHDTSSPWLLQRENRTLSHGCVRVEKPLELALFLLDDTTKELSEKIRYTMTAPFIDDNDSARKARIDRKMLVSNVKVAPAVPVFIAYYTIFYGVGGGIESFNDIYGYDEPLARELSPFNNK